MYDRPGVCHVLPNQAVTRHLSGPRAAEPPDGRLTPIAESGIRTTPRRPHLDAAPAGNVLDALVDDLDIGFAELVRTYEPVVFSVALRVSGRFAEAEELASESFLRSYLALRGYEPSRIRALRPRPWLITIMLNIWRNTVRTASRRPQQITMADPPEKPCAEAGVEEQVEQRETRRELSELLALLPENQRLAVVLRHVVGLSIAEIAIVMRLPEGTAKSHVSRGLRALRDLCGITGRSDRSSGSAASVRPFIRCHPRPAADRGAAEARTPPASGPRRGSPRGAVASAAPGRDRVGRAAVCAGDGTS